MFELRHFFMLAAGLGLSLLFVWGVETWLARIRDQLQAIAGELQGLQRQLGGQHRERMELESRRTATEAYRAVMPPPPPRVM